MVNLKAGKPKSQFQIKHKKTYLCPIVLKYLLCLSAKNKALTNTTTSKFVTALFGLVQFRPIKAQSLSMIGGSLRCLGERLGTLRPGSD